MNKVIIVGHPSVQIKETKDILVKCGMQEALVSRREKLSAQEITRTICHAHAIPSVEELQKASDFSFISVESVWQNLALDLLLGNVDNNVWGWADAENLPLLKYWQELDSKIAFVLVYDDPQRCLKKIFEENLEENTLESNIEKRLNNWFGYNRQLLDFYLEHSDKCILVHAQQVKKSINSYIQQIEKHVGVLPNGNFHSDDHIDEKNNSLCDFNSDLMLDDKDNLSILEDYTFNLILDHYEYIKELYNELQSVSNLPTTSSRLNTFQITNVVNILRMEQQQKDEKIQTLLGDIENIFHENKNVINDFQLKLNQMVIEKAEIAEKSDWQRRHIEEINKDKEEQAKLLKESKQHLENLNKEKAEFAAKADWRRRHIEEINKVKDEQTRLLKESTRHLENLKKEKAEIAAKADWRRRHIEEINKVKDEQTKLLEESKQYLENLKKEKDEIKSKADWRFKRIAEITEVQKQQENVVKQYKEKFDNLSKEYVEQQKRAQIAIQEKELLANQLIKLQIEFERTITSKIVNQAKPLYGAADRVKEQLPYKLGSAILQQPRSIKGILTLPLTLRNEKKRYMQEQPKESSQNLPLISEYVDAQDAERVKSHLSYRLGNVLVEAGDNPANWVKLPWKFYNEFVAFRKGK